MLVSYLDEHQDAEDVARLVQEAGRQCVLVSGDLSDPSHCRAVIERAVAEFGGIDILVSNAAYQMSHDNLEEISDEEWDYTFRLNVGAYFYLAKAAVAHMAPGSSIIGSSSVNSDMPSPALAPYAATKGSHRQLLGQPGTAVGGEGDTRQQRCARAHLDAADPIHDAARQSRVVRREHPAGAGRAADRAGAGLRASGLR